MLLTLLGAAGEALGYDRHLKSNTTKRRTHSLLRQGSMLYELIPTMPEHRLQPPKAIQFCLLDLSLAASRRLGCPSDFAPVIMPLNEALDFVATEGFFWINA